MLPEIVNFSDDAVGLEKSLRCFQYVAQTAKALLVASAESSKPWGIAQSHLALARRYFRLLKWHGSWSLAYQQFSANQSPLIALLEVSKWSWLGLYFFLEMFTITNAMGVTSYEWGPGLQHEANKCWLYAIVSSIFVSLYQIVFTTPLPIPLEVQNIKSEAEEKEKSSSPTPERKVMVTARSKIYRQLVIDLADVIIPAVGVGWLDWDEVYVGVAGTISSVVAGQEVWRRVQSQVAKA